MSDTVVFPAKRRAILNQQLAEEDIQIGDLTFHQDEIGLTVSSDWSKKLQKWKTVRRYTVKPTETQWNGRSFDVVRDGGNSDGSERYAVFVSGDENPSYCECKGYAHSGYCIHLDLTNWIIHNLLENP